MYLHGDEGMFIFVDLAMLIVVLLILWFAWSQILMPILFELPVFWIFTEDGRNIMKEAEKVRKNNLTEELKNIKRKK